MPKDTLRIFADDMSEKVSVKTQRSKSGTMPKGMKSLAVNEKNLVIGSDSAMDASPVKDVLGDTSRNSSFPGMPKADIDINKRP